VKMNETEPPVYVITERWICQLWFPAPNCDRRVIRANITCWMYSAHLISEMYDDLKSFQIVISFQPGRSLSFAYSLDFFCTSYKKSRNLYDTNKLSISKWQIKF
jgi:hypothetical protein